MQAGAAAAQTAAETIKSTYIDSVEGEGPFNALGAGVRVAHERVSEEVRGGGTTAVAMAIEGDKGYVTNVGDSTAILIRDGEIQFRTKEDSWLAEEAERTGLSKREVYERATEELEKAKVAGRPEKELHAMDNRARITQMLGGRSYAFLHISELDLRPGDEIILFTDGLVGKADNLLQDEDILRISKENRERGGTAGQLAGELYLQVEDKAQDNLTVAVVRYGGKGEAPPPAEPAESVEPAEPEEAAEPEALGGKATIEFAQSIERIPDKESDFLRHYEFAEGEVFIATDTGYRPAGGDANLTEALIARELKSALENHSPAEALRAAIKNAHEELAKTSRERKITLGTTAGVLLVKGREAYVALAGNTAAALVRDGELTRLHGDTSEIFPLGAERELKLVLERIELEEQDVLILGTDGVLAYMKALGCPTSRF